MRPVDLPKQRTLSNHIFEKIKEDIVMGIIPQGHKIKEVELAKSYQTSRGPLREALYKLEYINLVKRTPHSGTKVITLDFQTLKEVYQVREAMESFAARLASMVMTKKEIGHLHTLLQQHEISIKKSAGKVYFQKDGDLDFHYFIFSKCQNQWLINYLNDKLYQVLRMCRQRTSQLPFRVDLALREHYHIFNAIRDRDAEFVEILMRRHIHGAWKTVKSIFNEHSPTQ